MGLVEEFVSHRKTEAHNHLNLGMLYNTYKVWAGFEIPDFPRNLNGLAEMHEIIGRYTRPRAKSAADAHDLFVMALNDAVADGVTVLEGSVDLQFVGHCGGVPAFVDMIAAIRDQFSDRIEFRPELGMGKTFPQEKIQEWVPACLASGVFKSIDLYGPEVFEGLEPFKGIYELAGKLGIKRKAHVGEFSDAKSVAQFVEYFELDEVQHGIGAAGDNGVLKLLADNHIRCNITPISNVMLGAVPSLKEHPIRKMADAGVPVSLGTDDLLFFNRTVSQQCADLVDCGLFTKKELFTIIGE